MKSNTLHKMSSQEISGHPAESLGAVNWLLTKMREKPRRDPCGEVHQTLMNRALATRMGAVCHTINPRLFHGQLRYPSISKQAVERRGN